MIRFVPDKYDPAQCVRIVNVRQIAYYLKYIKPIDLYTGYNNCLVAVFDKEESKPYYDKWLSHKIDEEEKTDG